MVALKERCVIVSASPQADRGFIASQITDSDFVICADGGADILFSTGILPDMIVGDFDSSKRFMEFNIENVISLPSEKNDTDTMYCVRKALEIGYTKFLILGATGGRLDHELANISVLLYLQNNKASGVISDGFSDVTLLNRGENKFSGLKLKTLSVMPYACDKIVVSYTGLKFPLTNHTVTAEYPFSISNVAADDDITINLQEGRALLIIPHCG